MNQAVLVLALASFLALSQRIHEVTSRDGEDADRADVMRSAGSITAKTSAAVVTTVRPYEPRYGYIRIDNAVYPLLLQSEDASENGFG